MAKTRELRGRGDSDRLHLVWIHCLELGMIPPPTKRALWARNKKKGVPVYQHTHMRVGGPFTTRSLTLPSSCGPVLPRVVHDCQGSPHPLHFPAGPEGGLVHRESTKDTGDLTHRQARKLASSGACVPERAWSLPRVGQHGGGGMVHPGSGGSASMSARPQFTRSRECFLTRALEC